MSIQAFRNFCILAVLLFISCSSEPKWADPEAHEKTEQLRVQYSPIIAGTWHIESITDNMRFFECLTFNEDGSLKGIRKWQSRKVVTIDGKKQPTDWQDVDGENGSFTGSWKLSWKRETEGAIGGNRLMLIAGFDDAHDGFSPVAYGLDALLIDADESTLCIGGGMIRNGTDGSTIFTRGSAESGF